MTRAQILQFPDHRVKNEVVQALRIDAIWESFRNSRYISRVLQHGNQVYEGTARECLLWLTELYQKDGRQPTLANVMEDGFVISQRSPDA